MRSRLSEKFFPRIMSEYTKEYKSRYKKENDSKYEGNVLYDITAGVIEKKKIPDIDDVITLIKLGNNNCSDDRAYEILDSYFDNEDNKQRGLVGAFCDLCKDLCIDIPVNSRFTDAINQLEDTIAGMIDARNRLKDITSKLSELLNNMDKNIQTVEKADAVETAE